MPYILEITCVKVYVSCPISMSISVLHRSYVQTWSVFVEHDELVSDNVAFVNESKIEVKLKDNVLNCLKNSLQFIMFSMMMIKKEMKCLK